MFVFVFVSIKRCLPWKGTLYEHVIHILYATTVGVCSYGNNSYTDLKTQS